jgi:hypothetical protein
MRQAESTHAQSPLRNAMYSAYIQQAIVMILAAMVPGGGRIVQVCAYAILAFWGGVFTLCVRSRWVVTKVDLILIRGGYILVCVISYFVTRWFWHLRGYDHVL